MSDPKPATPTKTLASFLNDWAGQGFRLLKGNVEVSGSGVITLSLAPNASPGEVFVCTVKGNVLTAA